MNSFFGKQPTQGAPVQTSTVTWEQCTQAGGFQHRSYALFNWGKSDHCSELFAHQLAQMNQRAERAEMLATKIVQHVEQQDQRIQRLERHQVCNGAMIGSVVAGATVVVASTAIASTTGVVVPPAELAILAGKAVAAGGAAGGALAHILK